MFTTSRKVDVVWAIQYSGVIKKRRYIKWRKVFCQNICYSMIPLEKSQANCSFGIVENSQCLSLYPMTADATKVSKFQQ